MEPNSFTSEPQYQRPDQRNSDIDYIRRPEPLVVPSPAAVPVPVTAAAPGIEYGYDPTFAKRLFAKMGREYLTCNRLDYYGNAIPLGSWCYALAFIIYGFYRCKVYRVNDTFLWAVILLFGGIGQVTAGFLEFCKGRGFPSALYLTYGFYRCKVYRVNDTFLWAVILLFGGIGQVTAGFLEFCKGRGFPSALYLTYGFYCLSHYAGYTIPQWFNINQNYSMLYNFTEDSICAFYSGWVVLSFGLLLASVRTNCLYLCQCFTAFVFFLLRAVGEGCGSLGTKRNAAGILQAISGFFSLLLCFSQIINNETCYRPCFPTFPLSDYNDIDIYNPINPVAAPITAPVQPPIVPS
jgi:succinate-acetate transporter protein